jgi:hypothetical protein
MRSTILVDTSTRDNLKQIGIKGETYDEIIRQLLEFKIKNTVDPHDRRIETLQSSESSR